jgi:ketosteroid isomerase-like protein
MQVVLAPNGGRKFVMMNNTTSRRSVLSAGAYVLLGAAGLVSSTPALAKANPGALESASTADKEAIVRAYYSGYEKKDWDITGGVLADDFTFSSPNGDDHISKAVFKEKCFLSQLPFIKQFELQAVQPGDNDAFVMYLCRTTGATLRNIDYFRFADGKVSSIDCFFGSNAGYPQAAASRKQ